MSPALKKIDLYQQQQQLQAVHHLYGAVTAATVQQDQQVFFHKVIQIRFAFTLLIYCSEYPRDKLFLLAMVSYLDRNINIKEKKYPTSPFRVTCQLAKPNQPFYLNRPGQLAGNPERAGGFFFSLNSFIHFLKYETIVSINGLSLGYSE